MNIINIFKYFFNYKLKPIFWLKNFNAKKLHYKWEETNGERIEIINHLIKKTNGINYLEIGCDKNVVFNQISCVNKVGVDPNSGGTIRDTSDNFFKTNNQKFDVIFIDGLHHFDQVYKDFKNSFNFLNEGGYIILHDLIPRNWLEEHVPRISNNWCGDVWKISFLLNNIKNHEYSLLLTDFGLGVFKKKSKNIELTEIDISNKNFDYFINNYSQLNLMNKEEFLNLN